MAGRLEARARVAARAARTRAGRVRASARSARTRVAQQIPGGPRIVYARVLDGEHLWLAVPAGAGRPALWDERRRTTVDVVDDLPPGHVEHDPQFVSVRWRLTDALPETDGAELLLVTLSAPGRKPTPLRPPMEAPSSWLRTPSTSDGRWMFELVSGPRNLRVRRTTPVPSVPLLGVQQTGTALALTCGHRDTGPSQLLFLDKKGRVAHEVPTERTGRDEVKAQLAARDLPRPGQYRLAIGTPDNHVSITRRVNDLVVGDEKSVLMPLVMAEDSSQVVGNLRYRPDGVLHLVRNSAGSPKSETPA